MGIDATDASYFLELQTQTGWGRTLASFADWCAPQPGWRILDVGCGPGLLPALIARKGCWAVGVDLDSGMFQPAPLHPEVLLADVLTLPFDNGIFHLVTASNLLFLLTDPSAALDELRRLVCPGGQIAMLNPSEHLSLGAAHEFAEARGLEGLARDTLLNWAARAEIFHHWTAEETDALLASVGVCLIETTLKMGPGFARFSRGGV